MKITSNQNGSHLIAILLLILVLGTAGFAGWKVTQTNKDNNSSNKSVTDSKADGTQGSHKVEPYTEWSFDGNTWTAVGTPPQCSEPLSFKTPIDLIKADSKLLPGQLRGGDYKPHGGLGLDFSKYQNKVDVYAMYDAYLYRGARYIEAGEVQYMIDFMHPCGIMFRYDHLLTLSDDMAKHVSELPEPLKDESRTHKFKDHALVKAGTVIAAEVGFRGMQNPGFDIGAYDLRQPNKQSKTELFKTNTARVQDKEQSYYAVCWFDMLPSTDSATIKSLPVRGGAKESTSDFCEV